METRRYAAIDIGTVTCRLLIADAGEHGLHEVLKRCAITDLGEGVDATGVLLDAAMKRVDECVASYLEDIDRFTENGRAIDVVAVATSASRDARNASVFVDMLARRGVRLSVIPGRREAALSFKGASAGLEGKHLLVADIGGGSTELGAGIGGDDPLFSHSFDVGCRRVTERFIHSDPPSPAEMASARAWFHPRFAEFFGTLATRGFEIDYLVAVAGTATSIVSVDQHMDPYDSARVNGTAVSPSALAHVLDRLAALTLEQRRCVTGLQPGRAPVIVAGVLILQDILQSAGTGSFVVSESDILQGIVMDAAQQGL